MNASGNENYEEIFKIFPDSASHKIADASALYFPLDKLLNVFDTRITTSFILLVCGINTSNERFAAGTNISTNTFSTLIQPLPHKLILL